MSDGRHTGSQGPNHGPQKIEFTPDELELIKSQRKKFFLRIQVPISLGSAYGTFYLMKKGIWGTSGPAGTPLLRAYLPKCSFAFFASYALTSVIGVGQIYKELIKHDGNFSRRVREGRQGGPMDSPTPPMSQDDSSQPEASVPTDQNVIDSVLKPSTQDLPPTRSLTYDDLRRKSRMQPDAPPKTSAPIKSTSPISSEHLPDPVLAPPVSKEPLNKYGDTWSDT